MKTLGALIITASLITLLAFTIGGDRLGIVASFAALLVGIAMLTEKSDVTPQWLREQERQSWRVGVEQSRSTWPWKVDR
jgi:hypothetical protein